MTETDFNNKLIKIFKTNRMHGARFIWKYDSHFKSGHPDIAWRVAGRDMRYIESKLCKKAKLPKDLWSLCSKIQVAVIKEMKEAGIDVSLFVMHRPPSGLSWVYIINSRWPQGGSMPEKSFWEWWYSETV